MKKYLLAIIVCLMCVTLIGCKKDNESVDKGKELVLYFSATGTTKGIAERIATKADCDIIEIVPKVKYEGDDLEYGNDKRATMEQSNSSARPEIENVIDITDYNTIYIGYPIWWGNVPKIILTLLDTYDFSDKTIVPFCTSGSSGISGSVDYLRKYNQIDEKNRIAEQRRQHQFDIDKEYMKALQNSNGRYL